MPGLLVLAPALAHAQAVCPPDYVGCHLGEVDFTHRDALFDDVMLDTGWVPMGSPVQVRFALFVGGSTQVDMGGSTITSWPGALDVGVVGRPGTGHLVMNYGIEIIARIRIDVTIAGTHYLWEGDIPIGDIPRDLRLAAEATFDPFLLPPSMPRPVTVSDTTETVRLYDVGLSSIISLPGIGGGFAVDAQAQLDTSYQTDSIHITDSLSDILMENGRVIVRPALGMPEFFGFKDLEVLPHGTVGYDGMINILPTLYVTLPGWSWSYTFASIPVPIVDFDSNTDFNTDVVHVPLPDIDVDPSRLDFGMVESEGIVEQLVTIANEGEDILEVTVAEPAAPFIASQTSFSVPPSSSVRLGVTFHASGTSDLTEAELLLQTNDPDEPVVSIALSAFTNAALGDPDAGVPDAGGGGVVTDGGCGCRAATPRNNGAFFVAGLVALALVMRRRPRSR